MKEYIVETSNLKKNFKDYKAVKGIDLKVPKGCVYGFLGPNGAGKSTTLRMLLGLMKASSGEIMVLGKDVNKHREEILKEVGALIESPSYYGHLTAYENLDITRKIIGAEKENILKVLDIVKLSDVKGKKVKEFSLGMKQRLGIAQALMGNPRLLILDEPTNGLDPAGIHEIRELLKFLAKEKKITVIISSHILSEIELVVDYVGIIKKGELLFQGKLEELKDKNGEYITVAVDKQEEAIKLMTSRGYLVRRVNNNKLSVKQGGLRAAKLCKELILAGIDVSYLSERQDSLEDIFLELTGGALN